jgi:poly(A) polymerase
VVLVLARRLCSKAASSDALERYCLHLKTSREETQRALETLDTILVLKDLPPDCRPGLRRRLFRRPMAGAALRMLEALAQVLGGTYPSRARQLRQRFEAEAPSALAIQPLLRGGDLIAAGLKPGPRFAELLDELELLQLEGRLSNRQEALEALEQLLAPHRGA